MPFETRSLHSRSRELARTSAMLVALSLLLIASCSRAKRFNVLLVTLDTTRADYLGTYGREGAITPNFDQIAREGTRFDLAIASAAVTPVAHAAILTGLLNMEHGLRVLSAGSGYALAPDVPTLATVLKNEGYATSAFHSAFPVSKHFGFDHGFDVFESIDAEIQTGPRNDSWDVDKFQRRSDETTDLALATLAKEDEPFFTWVHYWDPHDPMRVPPAEFLPPNLPKTPAGGIVPSKELYAAEVRYVDAEFGRMVDALKKSGEYERTLIVIVADHGEGLGDHDWGHHRILYQEQIRVPLIVRIPDELRTRAPAPSVATVVRTSDIFPTVLDYLGMQAPRPVSGKSLRTLIEGGREPERIAYADQINGYDQNAGLVRSRPMDDFLYCAMDSSWKLIYRPSYPDASELYHIAVDSKETKNLYSSEPKEAARLKQELARLNGWVVAPFPRTSAQPDAAGATRALNGLGYTEGTETPQPAASEWSWACPVHPEHVTRERALCPQCSSRPVLVRTPK